MKLLTTWLLLLCFGATTCSGYQESNPPTGAQPTLDKPKQPETPASQPDQESQQEPSEPMDPEARRFQEADLDADGFISFIEMKAYVDDKLPNFKQHRRLIEDLDRDGDQKISNDEFAGRRELAKQLQDQPVEFTDQLNNRFDNQDPRLGTEISNLVAFDENGKAVNFDSFLGKHTVVTFGCLT